MTSAGPAVLSLSVLAALVLLVGGIRLLAIGRDRPRGGLMVGAALVLLANVAILAWPRGGVAGSRPGVAAGAGR